jgi:hypothetical protein
MIHFRRGDETFCGCGRARVFFDRFFKRGICVRCIVALTFTARVRGAS